jgi:hypothetical protein
LRRHRLTDQVALALRAECDRDPDQQHTDQDGRQPVPDP